MSVATAEIGMGKKRGRPASGKPWDEGKAVRIDASLASMARLIAGAKGVTIGQYLEPMIGPAIRRDYAALMKQLEKGGDE